MRTSHPWILWLALLAPALLVAGCATTPAPVVNHSFGGSDGTATATPTMPAAATAGNNAQAFGLGGHANGTLSAAGYTVARGDTLYSIAFAHGMDVRELAGLNQIEPPYVIHPGQVLKLKPAGATQVAAAVAAPAAAAPVVAHAAPPVPRQQVVPAPQPRPQPSGPVFGPVTTQTMTANGVAPAAELQAEAAAAAGAATSPVSAQSAQPPPALAQETAGPPPPVTPSVAPPPAPVAAAPGITAPPVGGSRSVAGIAWQWPARGKVVGTFRAGSGGDGAGLDIDGAMGEPVRAAASGTVVYSGNGLIGYGELIIIKHNDSYLSAYGHNSKRLVKEGEHVSAGQEIALMGASGAPRVELHFEIRKDGKPVDPLGYLPQR